MISIREVPVKKQSDMIKFCNLIYFNLYKLGLLINEISVYPINNFLFKNNKKGEEVIKATEKNETYLLNNRQLKKG